MHKAVLFDLDGTLLPMDQDMFIKAYFKSLAAHLAPYGYDPSALFEGIWEGTGAMIFNDGSCSNEQKFWTRFCELCGENARNDEDKFDAYYKSEFDRTKEFCGYNHKAKEIIRKLVDKGIKTVLATNPIFPATATRKRMGWAGLSEDDFELVTTYENIGYCKPNLKYYQEILDRIGVAPKDAIMVGNDVSDDMVAAKLGMKVFLLTDCLINKKNEDVSTFPHGGFDELIEFLHI